LAHARARDRRLPALRNRCRFGTDTCAVARYRRRRGRRAGSPPIGWGCGLDTAANVPTEGAGRMRVHQPGSHLLEERGARVRDWSWTQTRRRFSTLGRLVTPYRGRAILSLLTLLVATGILARAPLPAHIHARD